MSTILAIECSTETASAALFHGAQMLVREVCGVQTHSQTMLPMVQSLLTQAKIALRQCDAIAFGAGPGSFTGVRTACGIAQGLAFGAGLPVLPIVSLLAMAQACRDLSGASECLCVLDARMGEVYWAQYRYSNGWRVRVEPTLSSPSEVAPLGQVFACGNGLSVFPSFFESQAFAAGALADCMPHAAQVAALARIALADGQALPAREARPLYLRNKVALTTSERMLKVRA